MSESPTPSVPAREDAPTVEAYHDAAMHLADKFVEARRNGNEDLAHVYAEMAFDNERAAVLRAVARRASLATRTILFNSLVNLGRQAFLPDAAIVSTAPERETSENRFASWDTSLLATRLRECARGGTEPEMLNACADRLDALYYAAPGREASADLRIIERVAQLQAHRACGGVEHDLENGRIHGYCVVCLIPWPCQYAGSPPALPASPDDAPSEATVDARDAERWRILVSHAEKVGQEGGWLGIHVTPPGVVDEGPWATMAERGEHEVQWLVISEGLSLSSAADCLIQGLVIAPKGDPKSVTWAADDVASLKRLVGRYGAEQLLNIAASFASNATPAGETLGLMDHMERFVGWIGSGYNSRGFFPTTLGELMDDAKEFAARSSKGTETTDAD